MKMIEFFIDQDSDQINNTTFITNSDFTWRKYISLKLKIEACVAEPTMQTALEN